MLILECFLQLLAKSVRKKYLRREFIFFLTAHIITVWNIFRKPCGFQQTFFNSFIPNTKFARAQGMRQIAFLDSFYDSAWMEDEIGYYTSTERSTSGVERPMAWTL